AITEALEFSKIYGLEVTQIPTNLPLIREDLNDLIFATEDGKFHYVVKEIKKIHETGRPILVGTVSIEKSEKLAQLLENIGIDDYQVLNAKHHEREAVIIANAGKKSAITIATNMAGRGTDIKLAEGVRELGGLYIIGTERHEARRIDNQLRGRAGRQGDPGTTRFYVSLEDEVARLFGGDRVKRLLDMFGSNSEMDEQPLSQRMVSRSIERAQRQVEEYNYEIRKHLLEYDEVMDKQRKYIYSMRQEVLEDKDVTERLQEMIQNIISDAIDQFAPEDHLPEEWDMEGLQKQLKKIFNTDFNLSGDNEEEPISLRESIFKQVLREYERRHTLLEEELQKQYEQQTKEGHSLPPVNFKKLARKRIHDLELMVLLRAVDEKWIEHLYEMDYLRESVRLRAYGQRDPLLEYKQEAFELFQNLIQSIELNVIQSLFRITDPEYRKKRSIPSRSTGGTIEDDPFAHLQRYSYIAADKEADRSFSAFDTRRFALGGQSVSGGGTTEEAEEEKPKRVPIRVGPKVGPNDPCPCGSGKKYKKCCG
ncbi:MAG: SEC-C metal-binding domain-containing protein, partial [Candidatus Hydrogenedens sp.]